MACEGVRLTSFYAQPVCGVSRAALMTGSYPMRVGEPGNLKRLHTVPHPRIDWSCGEIFTALRELGMDENTLVVFTSDNGPWIETTRGMKPDGATFIPRDHSGHAEPLRGWKMSAWDGGSRVPCLIRWPGKIPAGWSSDQILSTMDLLPTFASLAKAELPLTLLDGRDASDFLMRKSAASPRDDYFYYAGCLLTGVRSGAWKLVLPRSQNPRGLGWWGRMIDRVPELQLFHLDEDPGETTNVAQQYPELVASLSKRLESARTELGDLDRTGNGARRFEDGPRKLQVPLKARGKASASSRDEEPPPGGSRS